MMECSPDLEALLRHHFGFADFRPYQRAVCEALVGGRDALLVMPTGSGKSLCYQLPGLARQGTTLVVSPLIALMEDQVAKLRASGLRAERIHSGRDRQASRQVCRDYLSGDLDFLFIAPERLGVSGFPELIARRQLALIAIDEAHCISHWGHDFRPDYRMLRERLPLLRSAPVIALTATATPRVQQDIVDQLEMPSAERFIHGFRRSNLALEVVELPVAARAEAVARVLRAPQHRPAVVYAPTRRQTEALAAQLSEQCRCAAYHAGMPAAERERVQSAFIGGALDVVVATIAFGMGVDKADVRMVIHLALPSSLEGYYQEVGRAGRDGANARALLLCSFADRRTHERFFERDYPEPSLLAQVHHALGRQKRPRTVLAKALGFDDDLLETTLDKLWVHGGLGVDAEDNVWRVDGAWRRTYAEQRAHKLDQLAAMGRYAQLASCRMQQLVRHFGDEEDAATPCGCCDVCAPDEALLLERRAPDARESSLLEALLEALRRRDGQTPSVLHRDVLGAACSRPTCEALISALARAELVHLRSATFTKDGQTIPYQRVSLTSIGRRADATLIAERVKLGEAMVATGGSRSTANRSQSGAKPSARRPSVGSSPASPTVRVVEADNIVEVPAALVEALKQWRLAEARRSGVPAFRVLSNRVLTSIAQAQPTSDVELLAVSGIGEKLLHKYGADLLAIVGSLSNGGLASAE